MQRLGGRVISMDESSSSVKKGETLEGIELQFYLKWVMTTFCHILYKLLLLGLYVLFNLLKPSGNFTYVKFNIKKSYVVPTLRLCVLYGSQNKQ
jgi:hypothetical protein